MHEFRCGNGLCVKKEYLCDGIRHCADGTDELAKNCNDNNSKDTVNKIIGNNEYISLHPINMVMLPVQIPFCESTIFKINNRKEEEKKILLNLAHDLRHRLACSTILIRYNIKNQKQIIRFNPNTIN